MSSKDNKKSKEFMGEKGKYSQLKTEKKENKIEKNGIVLLEYRLDKNLFKK